MEHGYWFIFVYVEKEQRQIINFEIKAWIYHLVLFFLGLEASIN